MIAVAIDAITANHIRALITNGVREGRTIEYKQALPGNSDNDKKEFLADVSSFANASGGDLIFGVTATNGVPTGATGLQGADLDKEMLRLDSVLRDAIAPRILGIRMQPIEGLDNGPGLVLRVARSWSGPHMVTFRSSSRFFGRSSAGKFQMDVDELRSAFALSGDLPERIRAWRDDRIAKVIADETPVPLIGGAKMILHLVPLDSFGSPQRIGAIDFLERESQTGFAPVGAGGSSHRLNLDGLLTYGGRSKDDPENREHFYCQVFRSGRIETVHAEGVHAGIGGERDGTPMIGSTWYEKAVLESVARYLRVLATVDVNPPILVLLTFCGVKDWCLAADMRFMRHIRLIDRDLLLLPEVLIEELPRDLPRLLRPTFDALWNACGLAQSLNYDEKGNWCMGTLCGVPTEIAK